MYKIIFKILSKFRFLFERKDIDFDMMMTILKVKFKLDSRRKSLLSGTDYKNKNSKLFSGRKNKNRLSGEHINPPESNQFFKGLIIYIFYGVFIIPIIAVSNSNYAAMSLIFGVILVTLTSAILADFSMVLLDINDRRIILTKPVSSKTLSAVKFIHISVYMTLIVGALAGPSLIYGLVAKGIVFGLVYFLAILLAVFFSIGFTGFIYYIVLDRFNGEKVKDIINYVQILSIIVIVIGYQIVIRIANLNIVSGAGILSKIKFWHLFLPSNWFGGLFGLLLDGDARPLVITLASCAIIIPITMIIVYIKNSVVFERKIEKLEFNKSTATDKIKGRSIFRKICKAGRERAYFDFIVECFKNDRDFRLKLIPNMAMGIIFPFIFIFASRGGFTREYSHQALYLYGISIGIMSLFMLLPYSKNYKAAWIYGVIPMGDKGFIKIAVIKAVLLKYVAPQFIITSIVFTIIYGRAILLDELIVGLALINLTILTSDLMSKSLPFTQAFENANKTSGASAFLFMGIAFLVGLLQYFMTKVYMGRYINLAILIIAIPILLVFVKGRKEKVEKEQTKGEIN